jgi:hypothetical protein
LKIYPVIFLLLFSFYTQAQSTTDSLVVQKKEKKKHSPKTATILSAILPGAGQIYNRKFWKTPLIYAGLGGLGYAFLNAQQNYSYYQRNLKNEADKNPSTINETEYGLNELQAEKIRFRKQRDLFGFGLIAVYAFNIIDANVDAHLKTFDVSDDLSLELKAKPIYSPNINGGIFTAGISLKFNFK